MTNWLRRGLVFAGIMLLLRLIQGPLINAFEAQSGLISMLLLAVFVIAVPVWAVRDGRADAIENPDPDRRRDLAMTWLAAGLSAGVISGAAAWLIGLFDKALYVAGLINELTVFAAFTALLVFGPGMAGVVIGRYLVDRNTTNLPQRHHGLAATDADRADTDVFAAVSVGAGETAGAEAAAAETTPASPASPVSGGAADAETTAEIPAVDENSDRNSEDDAQ